MKIARKTPSELMALGFDAHAINGLDGWPVAVRDTSLNRIAMENVADRPMMVINGVDHEISNWVGEHSNTPILSIFRGHDVVILFGSELMATVFANEWAVELSEL